MSSKDSQQAVPERAEHKLRFNFSFFVFAVLFAAAVYVSPRPPSSVRCGRHGATSVAFQGIPFVAGTNGVFVRARLCAFVCHPEHNLDDCNARFFRILKAPVQCTKHPNSNGTASSEPNIGSHTYFMYEGTPVLPLFDLGARLCTTVQVRVPAGLRGACSGRSKSLNVATNHGAAFRRARADQAYGNPQRVFFLSCALLVLCTRICYVYHTSPQTLYTLTQPRCNSSRA